MNGSGQIHSIIEQDLVALRQNIAFRKLAMPIFLIPLGFVHTKTKHLASFTNPYVVPNLYFNLEVGTQKDNFKELLFSSKKGLCETLKYSKSGTYCMTCALYSL